MADDLCNLSALGLSEDSATGDKLNDKSTNQAKHIHIASTAVIPASRDVFLDWFHGTSTTFTTLTAGIVNVGLVLEQREINPSARSIVIRAATGTALDYDYEVKFSPTGLAADEYVITSGTSITTEFTQVNLPATFGYDQFVRLEITPDAAQTGAQLSFRAYLTGRGG